MEAHPDPAAPEFRRATGADWPAIWPIWHEIVAAGQTYCWAPETDEPTARRLLMLPEPAEVWVATVAGEVAGTALLKPNQPGLGGHVANAGFMVSPPAAGRGVGRALARRIVARAEELGYLGMQFNAVVAANTRAVALWQALGFEIIGTVPDGFRHARLGLVDLHIMYRRLQPAPDVMDGGPAEAQAARRRSVATVEPARVSRQLGS